MTKLNIILHIFWNLSFSSWFEPDSPLYQLTHMTKDKHGLNKRTPLRWTSAIAHSFREQTISQLANGCLRLPASNPGLTRGRQLVSFRFDINSPCYIITICMHFSGVRELSRWGRGRCTLTGYIMAWRSCSFVCRLLHLIIIIMQVYAAECVSKTETIVAIIFHSIYGAVCLQLTQFACHDCENVYFMLLSLSNRKYESLTIV